MSLRKHVSCEPGASDPALTELTAHGYCSEGDAIRMANLVRDLIDHRCHIALSSRDPDLLDHYSRLLVRDVRRCERVRVMPYFPSSTETLLARINELLAPTTVAQATDRTPLQQTPIHVFVLHDTPALAHAELSLLVQLIQDLPGIELRLVLVLDSDDQAHSRLSLLGKRARHWDVPVPNGRWIEPALAPETASQPVITANNSRVAPKFAQWMSAGRWVSRAWPKHRPVVTAGALVALVTLLGGAQVWASRGGTAKAEVAVSAADADKATRDTAVTQIPSAAAPQEGLVLKLDAGPQMGLVAVRR
jgi:hypothetical protein